MNLYDLFRLSLDGRSGETALEFGGRTWTFGDLDRRSARVAAYLAANGFRAGDRLAVQMANSVEMIDVFLASVRLGVLFTPINVLYREREVAHIMSDAEPRAMLTPEEIRAAGSATGEPPTVDLEGDAPAALIYTSGTTGRSKGAVLTHNNFIANATALHTCWQMSPTDRLLLPLPLFHVHGLANGLHTWLATGYRMRLLDRFRKETILDEMLDFQPTVFFGVPTIYERLLSAPPDTARRIGERMRLFVSGSAPLPARTLERFHDALRPHDSRALRHDRDAHDHVEPLRRRAAAGDGRQAAARCAGAPGRRGSAGSRSERLCRLLAQRARPRAKHSPRTAGSARAIWPGVPMTATTR